ncbi:MAG TPA: hypothetical protein VGJ95_22340 [Pseudonocardiaceae bacterium]
MAGAQLVTRHQLTPELAAYLARARLVVLIDAAAEGRGEPGTVSVHRVEPGGQPPGWSHHLDPGILVGLAAALYGATSPAFQVTVSGAFFGYADRLSPAVRRALPEIVDIVGSLLTSASRRHPWPRPCR